MSRRPAISQTWAGTYLYELVAILSVHVLGRLGSLCMGAGATARAQAKGEGPKEEKDALI